MKAFLRSNSKKIHPVTSVVTFKLGGRPKPVADVITAIMYKMDEHSYSEVNVAFF